MKTMLGLLMLALPLSGVADVVVPIDSVESYVNIRKSPEAGTEVVGRLQKGEPLKLVESVPGWNKVELADGGTGFVSADWSTIVVDEVVDEEAVADVVGEAVAEVAEAVEAVAESVLGKDNPYPCLVPVSLAAAVRRSRRVAFRSLAARRGR